MRLILVEDSSPPALPENQVSLLINEDRTLDTFTGSQGNPTPGEGKHNLNTALGGEQLLGFAEGSTLSMWLKATFDGPSAPEEWSMRIGSFPVFEVTTSNVNKAIGISFFSPEFNGAFTATFREFDNAGNYPFSVSGIWSNIVIETPTSTVNNIRLWSNGAELVPFSPSFFGDVGFPDPADAVVLGDTGPFAPGFGSDNEPFRGNLGHIAMWNVQLDQTNINEIFNPSVGKPFDLDLNANSGGYTQAANLIQYWKPGAINDINQFGTSFKTGGGHNLQNGSDFNGLTAWTVQIPLANRVADVPA